MMLLVLGTLGVALLKLRGRGLFKETLRDVKDTFKETFKTPTKPKGSYRKSADDAL